MQLHQQRRRKFTCLFYRSSGLTTFSGFKIASMGLDFGSSDNGNNGGGGIASIGNNDVDDGDAIVITSTRRLNNYDRRWRDRYYK